VRSSSKSVDANDLIAQAGTQAEAGAAVPAKMFWTSCALLWILLHVACAVVFVLVGVTSHDAVYSM
jgi:hypothetical protein